MAHVCELASVYYESGRHFEQLATDLTDCVSSNVDVFAVSDICG